MFWTPNRSTTRGTTLIILHAVVTTFMHKSEFCVVNFASKMRPLTTVLNILPSLNSASYHCHSKLTVTHYIIEYKHLVVSHNQLACTLEYRIQQF
jgi:hypothetical protein